MNRSTEVERDSVIELPDAAKEALWSDHAFFTIRPISLGELDGLFRDGDPHRAWDFTPVTPTQAFEIAIPIDVMGESYRARVIAGRNTSTSLFADSAEIMESNRGYAGRLHIAGVKSVTGSASLYVQADAQNILAGRGPLINNTYVSIVDGIGNKDILVGVGRNRPSGPLWMRISHYPDLDHLVRALPVVVPEQVVV